MMDFLLYEGKVAIVLLVFYLFYRFLLKKETFHRFNRVVLVGTAVLSFVLPLCIITIHKQLAAVPMSPAVLESTGTDAALPEMGWISATAASTPWWPVALTLLFWAGVAFVLSRVIISILSILRIIHNGEQVREEDGCLIIVTERDIDPFSWMKYIVLSRKDWENDHAPILTHEKAHVGFGHSIEILLVDVLSAFQWFNPAIWMLRADLQELHEFEADDAVLRAGTNIKAYQYLLIRKAVSKSGYSVANSFNHSILKNRITMMSKSRSPLSRGLRVLYVIPLVCLALGLQARTVYVPMDKDSDNFLTDAERDTVVVRSPAASAKDAIVLNVRTDGQVESGGRVLSIEQLKEIVKPAEEGKPMTSVQICAGDNVPMGVINDVREELRAIGSVRIRYTSPSDQKVEIRNIPPTPSRKINGVDELWPGVKRDNIFIVRINANDKIFFGDAPRQDDAEMLRLGKDFLHKRGKDARFSMQVDRGTSYGAYRHMQELLFQIFMDVREEKAQSVYGKRMKDLTSEELSEINRLVPISVSETDMKKIKR